MANKKQKKGIIKGEQVANPVVAAEVTSSGWTPKKGSFGTVYKPSYLAKCLDVLKDIQTQAAQAGGAVSTKLTHQPDYLVVRAMLFVAGWATKECMVDRESGHVIVRTVNTLKGGLEDVLHLHPAIDPETGLGKLRIQLSANLEADKLQVLADLKQYQHQLKTQRPQIQFTAGLGEENIALLDGLDL